MKSMEIKPPLAKKLIFIFLLILGNAFMALFTFSETPPSEPKTGQPWGVSRSNYVKLRIRGELKSQFDPQTPVALIGIQSGAVIRDAFLIKDLSKNMGAEKFLAENRRDEYLVDVPKEKAERLLADEAFRIVPNILNLKKKEKKRRRRSYELVY